MSNDLSDFGFPLDQAHTEIEQRAADLAEHLGVTVEEARQRIVYALQGELQPLKQVYVGAHIPRWKRLIPGWRRRAQRRILTDLQT